MKPTNLEHESWKLDVAIGLGLINFVILVFIVFIHFF